jgi:alkanesulfonate monooxygenase SsuD/methylene tetrahydromethanopterin reductase-like flavin-dependent oxidoreductase (luciferase family)
LRIGTAVTLVPQYHPVHLAEQAAILDQLSGGRFDFGIGRGGYLKDFEVFGTSTARWEHEIVDTLTVLRDSWTNPEVSSESQFHAFGPVAVSPRPRTTPHPPVYVASSSGPSLEMAARLGLPIMHYFGAPRAGRIKLEAQYRDLAEAAGHSATAAHVHALICAVTDDEAAARGRILENVNYSYMTGDWPSVPRGDGEDRHRVGPDGKPVDRSAFAQLAVDEAVVGPPERVAALLEDYMRETGASRFALFMEPLVDPDEVLDSVTRFAREVVPLIESELAR